MPGPLWRGIGDHPTGGVSKDSASSCCRFEGCQDLDSELSDHSHESLRGFETGQPGGGPQGGGEQRKMRLGPGLPWLRQRVSRGQAAGGALGGLVRGVLRVHSDTLVGADITL